jgi:hypothetical protein
MRSTIVNNKNLTFFKMAAKLLLFIHLSKDTYFADFESKITETFLHVQIFPCKRNRKDMTGGLARNWRETRA